MYVHVHIHHTTAITATLSHQMPTCPYRLVLLGGVL